MQYATLRNLECIQRRWYSRGLHHQLHAPKSPCEALADVLKNPIFRTVLYAEHTTIDHETDNRFLIHDKQDLVQNCRQNCVNEHRVRADEECTSSPTKEIDPKLMDSVARLIYHLRAKLLAVVCDGVDSAVELNSDIGSLKALADKSFIKD